MRGIETSVPGFSGVPHTQDSNLMSIIPVQRDVPAAPKWNPPLAELAWHAFDQSTYLGV
jgi:hypothetical protein